MCNRISRKKYIFITRTYNLIFYFIYSHNVLVRVRHDFIYYGCVILRQSILKNYILQNYNRAISFIPVYSVYISRPFYISIVPFI